MSDNGFVDFRLTLVSADCPLLMHNGQLANPMLDVTRRLAEATAKRNKTLEDHFETADREWAGGVYYKPGVGVYIPAENVHRCLTDAARLVKLGKGIERGVFFPENEIPLQYDGPADIATLGKDENFRLVVPVKVGMKRVMRTRPKFDAWSLTATGMLDTTQLDVQELRTIAERAGKLIGLGDWRPRYGRFTAELTVA